MTHWQQPRELARTRETCELTVWDMYDHCMGMKGALHASLPRGYPCGALATAAGSHFPSLRKSAQGCTFQR